MSWDVLIFKYDGPPAEIQKLSADFVSPTLGDAAEVRERISEVFPATDWSDPALGSVMEAGYSIEFSLQNDGPVRQFALHVRGGGDPVVRICALCHRHGWLAFDTSAGTLLDVEKPSRSGWHSWQRFCKGVVHPPEPCEE